MYLKIKNGNQTKQYTLTNAYAKPYIKVSNSVLPLSPEDKPGLRLKAKIGNQTYRAMEYLNSSTSASYLTTAAGSAGLSSTTALTESSVTATGYLTKSFTSVSQYTTDTQVSSQKTGTEVQTTGQSYETKETLMYSAEGTQSYSFTTTTGYVVGTFDSATVSHFFKEEEVFYLKPGVITSSSVYAMQEDQREEGTYVLHGGYRYVTNSGSTLWNKTYSTETLTNQVVSASTYEPDHQTTMYGATYRSDYPDGGGNAVILIPYAPNPGGAYYRVTRGQTSSRELFTLTGNNTQGSAETLWYNSASIETTATVYLTAVVTTSASYMADTTTQLTRSGSSTQTSGTWGQTASVTTAYSGVSSSSSSTSAWQ